MQFFISLLLILTFTTSGLFAANGYKIVDITGNNAISSAVHDINQNGQICGTLLDGNDQTWKLFTWDRAEGIRTLEKNTATTPGIGADGEVYGTLLLGGWFWNSYVVFVWTPDGAVKELYNPKWSHTVFVDVNPEGGVLVADQLPKVGKKIRYAIYKDGLFEEILIVPETILARINEYKDVVGHKALMVGDLFMSYLSIYNHQGQESKGLSFENPTVPIYLGNSGEVLAVSYREDIKLYEGILWDTNENSLIKLKNFFPFSMNQQHQIVGKDHNRNFYVWENNLYRNLSQIVEAEDIEDPEAWTELLSVKKINDAGQIIGTGTKADRVKAFLLEPSEEVVEPTEIAKNEVPIPVTDINFEALIANGTHLVLFYSDFCGHCKKMHGEVANVEKYFKTRFTVLRANGDNVPKNLIKHNISGYPSLVLYKDGIEVERFVGYRDFTALRELINRALKTHGL